MAAMVLIVGEVDKKTIEKAVDSPVPAWLYGCGERLKHYVCKTNGVENSDRTDTQGEYWNAINPACRVVLKNEKAELNSGTDLERAVFQNEKAEYFCIWRLCRSNRSDGCGL